MFSDIAFSEFQISDFKSPSAHLPFCNVEDVTYHSRLFDSRYEISDFVVTVDESCLLCSQVNREQNPWASPPCYLQV